MAREQREWRSKPGIHAINRGNTALPDLPSTSDLVRFPEKAEMILLTDRPPQLETPLHYFRQDLTPNKAFFVRWHLEQFRRPWIFEPFGSNAIRDHQSTHCPGDDRPGRSRGQDVGTLVSAGDLFALPHLKGKAITLFDVTISTHGKHTGNR